jgi:hypothetical protein
MPPLRIADWNRFAPICSGRSRIQGEVAQPAPQAATDQFQLAAGLAPDSAATATGRMVLSINRNWRNSSEATPAALEIDRMFHGEGRIHSAPGNPP